MTFFRNSPLARPGTRSLALAASLLMLTTASVHAIGTNVGRRWPAPSPADAGSALSHPTSATARAARQCESYVNITEHRDSTRFRQTRVAVQWGAVEMFPACLYANDPDPATFRFYVNGVDVTSQFTVNYLDAIAEHLTVPAGAQVVLKASIVGFDTSGMARTDVDSAFVRVDTTVGPVAVTALEPDRAVRPGVNDSVRVRVMNTSATMSTYQVQWTSSGSSALYAPPLTQTITMQPGADTVLHRMYTFNSAGVGTIDATVTRPGWEVENGVQVVVETVPSFIYPKSGGVTRRPLNTTGDYPFTVTNRRTETTEFAFTATCTGGGRTSASLCAPSTPTLVLAPGHSATVLVTAAAGTVADARGQIKLRATRPQVPSYYDEGVRDDSTVTQRETGAQPLVKAYLPWGGRERRGDCPTIGAGGGAAVQCGSLLYVHALPGYRSLNELRPVAMLFNGATVALAPVLGFDYVIPANGYVEAFKAEVWRADGTPAKLAEAHFTNAWASVTSERTFRIALPIDASAHNLTTGAYPIEIRVFPTRYGVMDTANPAVTTTRLVVVDRRQSPFGFGWWPAGVERLHAVTDGMLRVTGDGSAYFYRALGSGAYESPAGERDTLRWDTGASQFRRRVPGGKLAFAYATAGQLLWVANNLGDTARYTWSGDAPTSVTDPVGKTVTFDYGTYGETRIHIPGVNTVRLLHDAAANVQTIFDPDGFATSFAYASGTHRMTGFTPRALGAFTVTYDTIGMVATVGGQAGSGRNFFDWRRMAMPAAGTGTASVPATALLETQVHDRIWWPRGNTVDTARFRQDRSGGIVGVSPAGLSGTLIERDSIGQALAIFTPGGAWVQQRWDANGNLTRSITRLQRFDGKISYDTTTYGYHPVWQEVSSITTPLGFVTQVKYDALGRRDTIIDAEGRKARIEYTAHGLPERVYEPAPADTGTGYRTWPTRYVYDSVTFNLLRVEEHNRTVAQYGYDPTNQSDLLTAWDASNALTTVQYDAMKRARRIERQPGNVSKSPSDSRTIPTPPSQVTRFDFNDTTRTRTRTDALGRVAKWSYDPIGRQTSYCPDTREPTWCETLAYGDGVNPTTLTTRKNESIMQEFDGAGRVTLRALRTSPAAAPQVSWFVYDANSNVISAVNDHSTVNRGYDPYGRLVHERQYIADWKESGGSAVEAFHRFDRDGRRVRTYVGTQFDYASNLCVPNANVEPTDADFECGFIWGTSPDSIAYTYDKTGALQTITNTFWRDTAGAIHARTWQYDRDRRGLVRAVTLPATGVSNNVLTYRYDAEDRLTFYRFGDRIWKLTPDDLGRLVTVTEGGTETTGGSASYYAYDGLGQLSLDRDGAAFAYDSLGNRVASAEVPLQPTSPGPLTLTYQYNTRGQLASKTASGGDVCASATFEYDQNGNQTREYSGCGGIRDRRMFYDVDGRMDSTHTDLLLNRSPGDSRFERRTFRYDALGRRIMMISHHQAAPDYGAWRYWWLDDHVAVKTQNWTDTTFMQGSTCGTGGCVAAGRWINRIQPVLRRTNGNLEGAGEWYFYGPGMDDPIASWNGERPKSERKRLYYPDYRGSIARVTDGDGTTQRMSVEKWSAFGRPDGTLGGSIVKTSPGYNGMQDAGGLVYMRNRWYDPNSGRFTQEDPIGYAGGSNLYAYVGNDPVSYSDPFGLCPPENDDYGDCTAGSSEWYAGRIARGEGNRALNELGGLGATCAESVSCMTSLIPATVVGAAVGRVAQALGVAGKATGNVSVAVGSQLEAKVAGRLFTGGANPIRASHGTGEVVGSKSADALRIYRQAQVKPAGHFSAGESVANLVNKSTGGNTHLVIKSFIWW